MRDFASLGKRKAVLGMIHLQPLPGTLYYKEDSLNQTLETAVQSARALYDWRGGRLFGPDGRSYLQCER